MTRVIIRDWRDWEVSTVEQRLEAVEYEIQQLKLGESK